jgi:hypothetical protein
MIVSAQRVPSEPRTDVYVEDARAEKLPSEPRTDVTSSSRTKYGRVVKLDTAWRRRMLFVDLERARQPQDIMVESVPAIRVDDQEALGIRRPGCDPDDILYSDIVAGGGLFQ